MWASIASSPIRATRVRDRVARTADRAPSKCRPTRCPASRAPVRWASRRRCARSPCPTFATRRPVSTAECASCGRWITTRVRARTDSAARAASRSTTAPCSPARTAPPARHCRTRTSAPARPDSPETIAPSTSTSARRIPASTEDVSTHTDLTSTKSFLIHFKIIKNISVGLAMNGRRNVNALMLS